MGESLTITANSFNATDSARCGCPDEKILPAPGPNKIAGFVEFRPHTSWEKDKTTIMNGEMEVP